MTFVTPGLLVSSILVSTIAQALLKYGVDRITNAPGNDRALLHSWAQVIVDPFVLIGLSLLVMAAPMWMVVLSRLPLSVAYPMVSVGYVISLGLGVFIFKEEVTILKCSGIFLIISGVIVLSRG